MTNYKKQIFSVVTTGVMLVNLATPAFAETTLTVSGNGASSDNNVNVNTTRTTSVVQSNTATVTNNVSSNANTGNNDANRNTGGNVTVDTGSATSVVDVANKLNMNRADVAGCGSCAGGDTTVKVMGNGADSRNSADVTTSGSTTIYQNNDADVTNRVDANAKTGGNDANSNTGGNVRVTTGNARADVTVSTEANANVATVGSRGAGAASGGSLDVLISGNGADSDSSVAVTVDPSVVLVQDNSAYVRNHVNADAKTGYNDANRNTGGNVTVDTGSARTDAMVDNAVNFNAAAVDCGCLLDDATAKIAGNGFDSSNDITANLGGDLSVFQGGREGAGNRADLSNWVDGNAKTGANDSNSNTGSALANDPLVFTGNASSDTSTSNTGNVNVYGPHADFTLPTGLNLDFHFDLSSLWGSLHM